MRKFKVALIFICLVMFNLILVHHVSLSVEAAEDYIFEVVTFDDQYEIGQVINLDQSNLLIDDQTIKTQVIVTFPDGRAFETQNVNLDQVGRYQITYRAFYQDKLYRSQHEFIVVEPLYSFMNEASTAVYGRDTSSFDTGIRGINVSLERGDIFRYNDIIDLSDLNSEMPAVEMFVTPTNGAGTKDIKKLIIEFTDIYDENNSIKIVGNAVDDDGDPSEWWMNSTYIQAGAFDSTAGIEWIRETVHKNNPWGYPANFSMYGMQSKREVVGEQFLSFSFDLDEKQVFGPAGRNGNFIIDLDDNTYVDQPWQGFTTGEVYMTITAEGYSASSFNFVITKIGLNDISPKYKYDLQGPEININFDNLNEESLPVASKGYSYPVFDASAYDAYTKQSQVKTRVFYNYYSEQRYEMPIKDGRFMTDRTGLHTIEYSAYDSFGNLSRKIVHINSDEQVIPIDLVVDENNIVDTSFVGAKTVIPEVTFAGGSGDLKLNVYAKIGESIISIDQNYFRPEVSGTYEMFIEIEDTIGQIETYTYDLVVEDNNLPVFITDAILPEYFIADAVYTIDELSAYDFNTKEDVSSQIIINDGNGTTILDSNTYAFTPDENNEASITFKATNDFGSTEITYTVKVIEVKDPWIDMTKYFDVEHGVAKSSSQYVSLTAENQQDVTFDYIHYLNARQFNVSFMIDPLKSDFDRFDLELKDYINQSESIIISFIKNKTNDRVMVEINNKSYGIDLSTTFINGGEIYISYDNVEKTISINDSEEKIILEYSNQEVFEGFSSNMLYLTGHIKEIYGQASIQLKNINGQLFSSDQDDFVKPFVSILGDYDSFYTHNQVATIFEAFAIDVLDPEVTGHLTVKGPNGNIITSRDGVALNQVMYNRSYDIKLDQYGSYLVTYTARDTNGSGLASFTYSLLVLDTQKPVITLTDEVDKTGIINEEITIPQATATDAVDGNLDVYYFIVLPNGQIIYLDGETSFIPTIKGVHKVRYFSVDSSGNHAFVDYTIDVK